MKKTLLLIFCLLGIIQVDAQHYDGSMVVEEPPQISAEQESLRLHRILLLNANQFTKVKDINRRRRQNLARVKELFPREPEKRDDKIHEMELQYDAEFAVVLTKKQFEEYLELNGRGASAQPYKPKVTEGPSFNEQIHAIIEKATNPAADSCKLALQDSLNTDKVAVSGEGTKDKAGQQGAKQSPYVKDTDLQISLTVKELEGNENKAKQAPIVSEKMLSNNYEPERDQPKGNAGKKPGNP